MPRRSNRTRPPRPFVRRFRTAKGITRVNAPTWDKRKRPAVVAAKKRIYRSREWMLRLRRMVWARLNGKFNRYFLREYHLRNSLRVHQLLDFTPLDFFVSHLKEMVTLTLNKGATSGLYPTGYHRRDVLVLRVV